ncbi:MAG: hypothetical protein RBU23_09595 [Candidatus Auribacterota bacterium]|nr:hypothetical protein [Candidatus Auribacterota bacterium]
MKQPKENKESKESKKSETQSRTRFEEKPPILSRSISLSKDRKWLIVKTIRTDIIHMNYMDKIFQENKNEPR